MQIVQVPERTMAIAGQALLAALRLIHQRHRSGGLAVSCRTESSTRRASHDRGAGYADSTAGHWPSSPAVRCPAAGPAEVPGPRGPQDDAALRPSRHAAGSRSLDSGTTELQGGEYHACQLPRLARRGGVGFAADQDHAPAEPLVALEVESLQLVSTKRAASSSDCSADARSRKRLTAMMSPSPQSIT